MSFQVILLNKTFTTNMAFVRAFPCVGSNVSLDIRDMAGRIFTKKALKQHIAVFIAVNLLRRVQHSRGAI